MPERDAPLLSVVLPTYREEGTIGPTLDALAAAMGRAGVAWEAVVVDDASPDATGLCVEEAARRHAGRIRLVVRSGERGLATAVVRGFTEGRGRFLAVMDADGQHPPEVLVAMLRRAEAEGRDVVVGSRHASGGSVGSFGPLRRLVSWGAGLLARLALPPVRRGRVTDPMSGLFLVRKACLDGVALAPRGYKVLLELLAKARPAGAEGRAARGTAPAPSAWREPRLSVAEVPYTFGARAAGVSKLGPRATLDYLAHLVRLGFADRENRRFVTFATVGATGVVVNLGILAAAGHFFLATSGWPLIASGVVAREVSVAWNFLLNDRITFHDRRAATGRRFVVRFLQFNLVSLGSFALYLALLWGLTVAGLHYLVAGAIGIALSFLLNFKATSEWTYKAREPGNGAAQG